MARKKLNPAGDSEVGPPHPDDQTSGQLPWPAPHHVGSCLPDSWTGPWNAFVKLHHDWWDRSVGQGPVYAIPGCVVEAIAGTRASADSRHHACPPLISPEDGVAEIAFCQVCQKFSPDAVGVWDDQVVLFPLLGERRDDFDELDRLVAQMNWDVKDASEQIMGILCSRAGPLEMIRGTLLGYAGKITFDKDFQEEKKTLQARWASLPDRPPLPLYANVTDQPPVLSLLFDPLDLRTLDEEQGRFLTDFGQFMRKWRLNRMITWDLPVPQGPLELVPLGLQAKILGPDALATTVPSFYDGLSGVDFRDKIRDQQRRDAMDDGVEMEHPVTDVSPRGGHASQYESAFRMWLIEQSFRFRHGVPRGLVGRLKRGFSEQFEISEARVQQIRALYSNMLA